MNRLLNTLGALVLLAVLAGGAWLGWRIYQQRSATAPPDLLATAPAPCPDDPNDLAGIEGWAPGAGQASKIGQTGAGDMGGLGGAIGGGAATPAPDSKKCTGISAQLDRYFARITATGEAIPSTGYDATARAAVLDAAPDASFAFVRDQVATDGYGGAMRGANGTLAAQSGSPADKALLLAALLTAKQVPVRFAHGTLSDAETDTVIRSMLAVRVTPVNADPEALKKLNLTATQVTAAGNEQRERVKALADDGIARARTATDTLLASAPALAGSDAAARTAWKSALKDHWWIQAQQNGTWTDLDPTLPDAKAGSHLGTPAGEPVEALPDAQFATVAIRLVGTFAENGTVSERTLLNATAKTADLALSAFSLVIGDHDKGAQNLTQARSFTPSITLGGAGTSGDAFAPDGTAARLATLRLQIVTQVAGGQARTAERTIVDRRPAGGGASVDPAWTPERTALALTATYMGLVVSGELNRDFTAKQDAQSVKLARAFAAYNAAGGNGRQLPPPGIAEAYPYEVMHYFLYDSVARMRLEDASNGGLRFFFDRPQVAMVHRGFTQSGKTRTGVLEFDIVDNGMAAVGTAAQNPVRANAVRGYLDTSIERHVLGVEPTGNTIALFDAAAQAGVKSKADARDPAAVRIVPDGNVSLGGRVVSGWWQLDPQTGNLVGRMAGGAGQAMVEYAIDRINDWSSLVSIMQFYGDFFRCIAMGVEAPLAGAGGQAQFNNCALGALCNFAESTLMGEAFSRCTSCTNIDALIYNFLDYGTYGKSSSPGSFGYVCGKLFPSPF